MKTTTPLAIIAMLSLHSASVFAGSCASEPYPNPSNSQSECCRDATGMEVCTVPSTQDKRDIIINTKYAPESGRTDGRFGSKPDDERDDEDEG